MKRIVTYLLGIITGIVLTLGGQAIIHQIEDSQNSTISMFDTPGDIIDTDSFLVIQVFPDGSALTLSDEFLVYYLFPIKGRSYYDGQEITIPKTKKARIVGTFRYENKDGDNKTVPIVRFFDN